jgi:2-deoxy-D-gluconate 3-dehydrogenase
VIGLRPPPGRRTRPGSSAPPESSSESPPRTVDSETGVARATAAILPLCERASAVRPTKAAPDLITYRLRPAHQRSRGPHDVSPDNRTHESDRPLASLVDLRGKVALVTGAAQGFGFACARRLAEAGAAVILADLRPDRLEQAGERLAAEGRNVATALGDVSVEDDVAAMVATAVERFGRLNVLVNNAGVFSNFLLESLSPSEFHRVLGVNVGGAFLCTKAAAAQMRRQGEGGSIINISSIDAVHPSSAGLSHYGTSKHAIWGLTKSMALELGPDGIRVNAIAPGPSLTEGAVEFVQAGAPEGIAVDAQWAAYEARIPLRRLADPDDVGRTTVFLASDLASYVSGAQIIVDGGLLSA